MEAIETTIERVCVALIARDVTDIPVLRSDEHLATRDNRAVIVSAREAGETLVVNDADPSSSTRSYEVEATLRGFAPAGDQSEESERLNAVALALRSTDGTGLDLSRFDLFHVFQDSTLEVDQDEDGRKLLTRTFKIAVEEAALPEDEPTPDPGPLPPLPE